ncbi:MAG: hypothetical protein LBE51_08950, partial [Acidovorax sp.]|nr:hypothetical protein [Acidovorax sp.]
MAAQTMLVGQLVGHAWIRGTDGSLTAIKEGMRIPSDARIVTGSGSSVELLVNGQSPLIISANQDGVLTKSHAEQPLPEDAAVIPLSSAPIEQVIADPYALDFHDSDAENLSFSAGWSTSLVRIASITTTSSIELAQRYVHLPASEVQELLNAAPAAAGAATNITAITDSIDTSTVTLTATASAVEGGIVTYTASVTSPVTGTPLVISLANGQSITIPINASSGSVDFTAPN